MGNAELQGEVDPHGRPLCTTRVRFIPHSAFRIPHCHLPADRKLDSRKARAALRVKSLRFASREEVERLTGLQPGSIPPFGSLFGLRTCCDPDLSANASINFNAGDHAISVHMAYTDYLAVEKPDLLAIT